MMVGLEGSSSSHIACCGGGQGVNSLPISQLYESAPSARRVEQLGYDDGSE